MLYRDYVDARALKLATMRRRLPVISAQARGPRLLDVGCATGFFIEAALEAGFDAAGIELSPVAIRLARPEVQARITCGDVNTLLSTDSRRFDVVTAFDIIEHTLDPAAFLDDIGRVLAPGGLLVLSTPDTGHWLRTVMRARWPMLQPDQHTYLFSKAAMRTLLVDRGYDPVRIEATRKVLTLEYLFGQLRQTNPTLAQQSGSHQATPAVGAAATRARSQHRRDVRRRAQAARELNQGSGTTTGYCSTPTGRLLGVAGRRLLARHQRTNPMTRNPRSPAPARATPMREGSRLVAEFDARRALGHGDAPESAVGRIESAVLDHSPSLSNPGSKCPVGRAALRMRSGPAEPRTWRRSARRSPRRPLPPCRRMRRLAPRAASCPVSRLARRPPRAADRTRPRCTPAARAATVLEGRRSLVLAVDDVDLVDDPGPRVARPCSRRPACRPRRPARGIAAPAPASAHAARGRRGRASASNIGIVAEHDRWLGRP